MTCLIDAPLSSLLPCLFIPCEQHVIPYARDHGKDGVQSIHRHLTSVRTCSNRQAKEDVISMDNGCVCCTVRGDLVKAFQTLSRRKEKYDAVIIETTGA